MNIDELKKEAERLGYELVKKPDENYNKGIVSEPVDLTYVELEEKVITVPSRREELLFSAVEHELSKRTQERLSENARHIVVAKFVTDYDFNNSAIAHKSAAGWADLLVERLFT